MKTKSKQIAVTVNILLFLLMIALCVYFIITSIDLASQAEPEMAYQITAPIFICLMFLSGVFALTNALLLITNYQSKNGVAITKIIINFLCIIAFATFTTYYVLFCDYFLLYLFVSVIDVIVTIYEMKCEDVVSAESYSYQDFEEDMLKLSQMKANNLIDDQTFAMLKEKFSAKLLNKELEKGKE